MALNHTTVSSSSMMAPPPPPPKNAGVETNDIQKRMAPWTAQMRDAFIKRALESEFTKGNQGPWKRFISPLATMITEDNTIIMECHKT